MGGGGSSDPAGAGDGGAGTANTGGGGAGAGEGYYTSTCTAGSGYCAGGNGGSGIVVISFTTQTGQFGSVLTVTNTGYVGINNSSPSYALDVSGVARFTGGYTTSDRRWKTNIEPINGALGTLEQLQPVNFDWRRDEFPNKHFPEGKQIGFIAQEVEKVLPNIVETDNEGYKSVSYQSVIPLLVEAVKELQTTNKDLAAQLKTANDNHTADQARLKKIEDQLAITHRKGEP